MTNWAQHVLQDLPNTGRFVDELGAIQNLGDLVRRLHGNMISLGGLQVTEYTPVFDILPVDVSIFTDIVTTTGSASVDVVDGEYQMFNPGGETCRLSTAQRGPYQPGLLGLPGIGARRTTAPSGTTKYRLGFFDTVDGSLRTAERR